MSTENYTAKLEKLRYALLGLNGLTIFTEISRDPVVQELKVLLETFKGQELSLPDLYKCYHNFSALAIKHRWPEYLIDKILETENPFTVLVSEDNHGLEGLQEHVARDLEILNLLYTIKSSDIKIVAQGLLNNNSMTEGYERLLGPTSWLDWEVSFQSNDLIDSGTAVSWFSRVRARLKESFETKPWSGLVSELTNYYQQVGIGIFSSYIAFRWESKTQRIIGISNPDPIRIEQLIGQTREQSTVLENTEHFLAGAPANNMILYGNRGTGKSSLVKALLNSYVKNGLRLVELGKGNLADFPSLSTTLGRFKHKFIIFIDDLSFDESDSDYKALKTLLEGGLETKPRNVVIYATSNRRHLVRETFSERKGDDVHVRDNMEEKLSLSDRFGITVTFPAPDQEGYLKIVEGLAEQYKIEIDKGELRQRALRWVMMHNARSGRTARQFIDHLIGTQLNSRIEKGTGI